MKKFFKEKSGAIMMVLGAVLLAADLAGVEGAITFAVAIVLIVEGTSRM